MYKTIYHWWNKLWPFFVFLLLAFFLIVPQINRSSLILGIDSVFHLNRFYDSMMQIKTGKFNYFLMNFGFGGIGRVVNALYGPVFSYFQGFLLLIAKNWYRYQLLSDICLSLVSSCSMYLLCLKAKLKKSLACVLALFYSTSSIVTVWIVSQQFTGWGAAFFPLLLIGGINLIKKDSKPRDFIIMGISVSILFQVHMPTAILGVLCLMPFFVGGFFNKKSKLGYFLQVLLAVLICLCLTGNVWGSLLQLKLHNNMLGPWPYESMGDFTSNFSLNGPFASDIGRSPVYGTIFSLIIIITVIFSLLYWNNISLLNKVSTITIVIFALLASDIFPWERASYHFLFLKQLIQFPRRFIVIPESLSLLTIGLNIKELEVNSSKWKLFLLPLLILSSFSVFSEVSSQSRAWNTASISPWRNHLFFKTSPTGVRQAFMDPDLSKGLNSLQKYNMDYLPTKTAIPLDGRKISPLYGPYIRLLTKDSEGVSKRVNSDGQMIISIRAAKVEKKSLPIVMYKESRLTTKQNRNKQQTYTLNEINQPQVTVNKGRNTFKLSFQTPKIVSILFIISIISWVIILVYFTYEKIKFR